MKIIKYSSKVTTGLILRTNGMELGITVFPEDLFPEFTIRPTLPHQHLYPQRGHRVQLSELLSTSSSTCASIFKASFG
jgi:hypothetical protein